MALNYDNFRALATRLLTENGVRADLVREEQGVYDPIADTDTLTVTRYPVNVVMMKLHQGVDDFDWQATRQTYELGKAVKAYLSGGELPAGVEPVTGDRLEIGGDVWTIRGNNPVRPDNSPVLHVLFISKGAGG